VGQELRAPSNIPAASWRVYRQGRRSGSGGVGRHRVAQNPRLRNQFRPGPGRISPALSACGFCAGGGNGGKIPENAGKFPKNPGKKMGENGEKSKKIGKIGEKSAKSSSGWERNISRCTECGAVHAVTLRREPRAGSIDRTPQPGAPTIQGINETQKLTCEGQDWESLVCICGLSRF